MDRSGWNYRRKKELFSGLDLKVITPCRWLSGLVKQSFLKNYPVEVIYNGIDRNVFRPTDGDFRKKYGLENKFIILGVASEWTKRKGLPDFITLDSLLDEQFKVVVVGLTRKQKKKMPSSILALDSLALVRISYYHFLFSFCFHCCDF
jgi:glycosyltransferase involved in cell wall biosynthesis